MPDGNNPQKVSIADFAKRIKTKFPGSYDDMDDADLVERIVIKNPTYADQVDLPSDFKLLRTTSGYQNIDSLYEQAGRKHNVDPNLLLEQGRKETAFDPNVFYGRRGSSAGAKGSGQFIQGTAKRFDVDVNDPLSGIEGQAKYMRVLLDQFDGDENIALAGYNSGEARNEYRAAAREGRPINWKIMPRGLQTETQDYVKVISGNLAKARQSYGQLRGLVGAQPKVADTMIGKRPGVPQQPGPSPTFPGGAPLPGVTGAAPKSPLDVGIPAHQPQQPQVQTLGGTEQVPTPPKPKTQAEIQGEFRAFAAGRPPTQALVDEFNKIKQAEIEQYNQGVQIRNTSGQIDQLGNIAQAAAKGELSVEAEFSNYAKANGLPEDQATAQRFNAERQAQAAAQNQAAQAAFKAQPGYKAFSNFAAANKLDETSPATLDAYNQFVANQPKAQAQAGGQVQMQQPAGQAPTQQPAPAEDGTDQFKPFKQEVQFRDKPKGQSNSEYALQQLVPKLAMHTGLDAIDIEKYLRLGFKTTQGTPIEQTAEDGSWIFELSPGDVESIQNIAVGKRDALRKLVASGMDIDAATKEKLSKELGLDPREMSDAFSGQYEYADVYKQGQAIKQRHQEALQREKAILQPDEPSSVAGLRAATEVGWVSTNELDALVREEKDLYKRLLEENKPGAWAMEYTADGVPIPKAYMAPERKEAIGKEAVEDLIKQYGSLSAYKKEQDALREKYKYRPMAGPLEFAKRFGNALPKAVGSILKAIPIAADLANYPTDKIVELITGKANWRGRPEDNPIHQIGQGIDGYFKDLENRDFDKIHLLSTIPDALGQITVQILAGVATGGATLPTAIGGAMGASSQYDEAAKFTDSREERLLAAAVGGAAAIPDAIIFNKWFKTLGAAEKTDFLNRFTKSIYARLGVKVGDEAAENLTRATITQWVKNMAKSGAFESVQEVSENKINDALAYARYDRSEERKKKLTSFTEEDWASAIGGFAGGFGGGAVQTAYQNANVEQKALLQEELKARLEDFIESGKITPEMAAEIEQQFAKAPASNESPKEATPSVSSVSSPIYDAVSTEPADVKAFTPTHTLSDGTPLHIQKTKDGTYLSTIKSGGQMETDTLDETPGLKPIEKPETVSAPTIDESTEPAAPAPANAPEPESADVTPKPVAPKSKKTVSGEKVFAEAAELPKPTEAPFEDESIKAKDFEKKMVKIDELVEKDPDLKDFIENTPTKPGRKIKAPIIVGDVARGGPTIEGGVIDGMHRVAQAQANGQTVIEAYVEKKPRGPIVAKGVELETKAAAPAPAPVETPTTIKEIADASGGKVIIAKPATPANVTKRVAAIDKELLGLSGAMTSLSDAGASVGPIMQQMKDLRTERDTLTGKAPEAKSQPAIKSQETVTGHDYEAQAIDNLKKTSRTASGVVDTSASPGKADKMTGIAGEQAAIKVRENFLKGLERVKGVAKLAKFTNASPESNGEWINEIAGIVNEGIVKDPSGHRSEDSDKFNYTRIEHLADAFRQFAAEFAKRADDKKADPIETAAWIEWRANLIDHFWQDGVGKISKLLATVPLIRAGLPLPKYRKNSEMFALAPKAPIVPDADGKAYLGEEFDKFLEYYRSLFGEAPAEKADDALKLGEDGSITVEWEGFTTKVWPTKFPEGSRKGQIQDATLRAVVADPGGFVKRYLEKYPTESNADNAKLLFDQMLRDPLANTPAVHAASSLVNRLALQKAMKDLPKGSSILIMAGGAASGKTTAARDVRAESENQMVVDTVAGDIRGNKWLIDSIIEAGHTPELFYVYLDPGVAAGLMVRRWMKERRLIPIKIFAQGHFGANAVVRETIDYLHEKAGHEKGPMHDAGFADDPHITLVRKSLGAPSQMMSIAELDSMAYNSIEELETRARNAAFAEYNGNQEEYTDKRIPDVLEGRDVEESTEYPYPGTDLGAKKPDDRSIRSGVRQGSEGTGRPGQATGQEEVADVRTQRASEESATGTPGQGSAVLPSDGVLGEELPVVSGEPGESVTRRGPAETESIPEPVQPTDRRGSESDAGPSVSGQRDDLPADSGSRSGVDEQPADVSRDTSKPVKRLIGTDGNYYVDDVEAFAAGGLKTKFRANVTAIETLRKIQAEGRKVATPEEQAALAKYIGWGQFPALFNVYNEKAKDWAKERTELLGLISKEEFESASASTKNAHYTSPQVVRTVWEIVQKLGFNGGNVVETSMGVGNFMYLMPADLRGTSRVTGIELDLLTAQIAKLLFPKYDIRQMGYQEFAPPKGFYDLAISNVPFGNYLVDDPKMPHFLKSKIHNYFFAKSLDNVRPGGLIAFITSTGTMQTPDIVEYLKDHADLVTAMRFPAKTFEKEAGTAVVTDLVVLRVRNPQAARKLQEDKKIYEQLIEDDGKILADYQKELAALPKKDPGRQAIQIRIANVELHQADQQRKLTDTETALKEDKRFINVNWTDIGTVPDPDGGEAIRLNQYYIDNPAMVLGTVDRKGTMYRGASENVSRTPDFEEKLAAAIAKVPNDVVLEREADIASTVTYEAAPESMRQGQMLVRDGQVFTREGSFLKEVPLSKKDIAKVDMLLKVRDALNKTAELERKGELVEAETFRKELNDTYDAFTKAHGTIRENRKLIELDPDHWRLLALEAVDKKGKVTGKADIFVKATVSSIQPASAADSYGDAIGIVLNQTGTVDIGEIARLMNREQETVMRDLVAEGLAFRDPRDGWTVKDVYLSGETRRKLREAREAATLDKEFEPNVAALEKVQPEDLPYRKITPTIGAVWIPETDVKQFMLDMLHEAGEYNAKADDLTVKRLATGDWIIAFRDKKLKDSAAASAVLGTDRRNFADIVSAAIRDMPIQLKKKDANGNERVDTKATTLANRKVKEVRQKFNRWVWADDARRERLHRTFNDLYNDEIDTKWNGQHLTLPGLSEKWQGWIFPHIKDAVYRVITQGRALFAHEVGTGKTGIAVAAAMELRRLKLAKKPAIVCLNANVEQFAETAREMYPHARILAAYQGMNAGTRKETTTRIMSGDWDIVILTHDNLAKIPMSRERELAFIKEELQILRDQVAAAEAEVPDDGSGSNTYFYGRKKKKQSDNRVVKALEAKIATREARLKELFAKPKDDAITFEETGIDALFVDEAHAFKNLDIYTTREGTKGIPSSASQRASHMFLVSRYISEINNGRGVSFLTGTPISNTTAETFNMMRYLMWNDLKARGIDLFDSWAANYGENETRAEMDATGNLKQVTRFQKFKNLDTLSSMLRKVMDVKYADELPGFKRPKRVDQIHAVPRTKAQADYQQVLINRAEALKTMTREERKQKGADNWLAIGTDSRKAALDMRLLDPRAKDDPKSKVNEMIRNVLRQHKATPHLTQLIFSDIGVNPTKDNPGFRLYGDIIDKLVKGGIPRDKIIDFSKFTSGKKKAAKGEEEADDDGESSEKEAAMNRLKSGDALVAIGSAAKLGTGVNVQDLVIRMHKLDVKIRPDLDEQEIGRGHRTGNKNEVVYLDRYTTQDTFDMFFYDRLQAKKNFIDSILRGEATGTFTETIDESLDYDTVVAVTASDPRIRERIEVMRELTALEEDLAGYQEDQLRMRDRRKRAERSIELHQERIDEIVSDRKDAQEHADNNTVTVGDESFEVETDAELRKRDKEAARIRSEVAEGMGLAEATMGTKIEEGQVLADGFIFPSQEDVETFDTNVSAAIKAELGTSQLRDAHDAIKAAVDKVVERLDSRNDWQYRNQVLYRNDGRLEIGSAFGMPLVATFVETKEHAISWNVGLDWSRGWRATYTNPAEIRNELHKAKAATTGYAEGEIAKLSKDIENIDKSLKEQSFDELPKLEELRKKLTRLNIELGASDITPEGFETIEAEAAKGEHELDPDDWKFGIAGSYGRILVSQGTMIVSPDLLPDLERRQGTYEDERYLELLKKADANVSRLGAKAEVVPFIVDSENGRVLFDNGRSLDVDMFFAIRAAFPDATFIQSEKNNIYVVQDDAVVAITFSNPVAGGISEDLLPAMNVARYKAAAKKAKLDAERFKAFDMMIRTARAKAAQPGPSGSMPLASKLSPEEEGLTIEEMRDMPFATWETILDGATVERFGDRLQLSPKSHEIYRRVLEELKIQGKQIKRGSTDYEDLFRAQFIPPADVSAMARLLREKAKEAGQKGYTPEEVATFNEHADVIEQASKAGKQGTAILYVFDSALPEEVFHQADYLGAADKSILNRHSPRAKAALDTHKVTKILAEKHFAKFNEYNRMAPHVKAAVMRAEIAPFLLGQTDEELKALGISPEMQDDYLLTWFEGYAEQNGIESLDNFEKEELNVQDFITKAKEAFATKGIEEAGTPVEEDATDVDEQSAPRGSPEGNAEPRGERESQSERARAAGIDLGPDQRLRSLPATMRAAGLDAIDEAYDVYKNEAAIEDATKLLEQYGIEGSIRFLDNLPAKAQDAQHAVLSFMLVRTLLNHATAIRATDPDEANRRRQQALDIAKEHAVKATQAGRYTQIAAVIGATTENLVYAVQGVLDDKYDGKKTISAEKWDEWQALGRKLEEAQAKNTAGRKEARNLKAQIKRLQDKVDGIVATRRQNMAARKKLVSMVMKDRTVDIDALTAKLKAQYSPNPTLKSALGASPAITETPEFRRWFRESKVVDENGQPLLLYHGTNADFDAFDNRRRVRTKGARNLPRGIAFFTNNPTLASHYAGTALSYKQEWWSWPPEQFEGGNVIPVYLSIEKPKIVDAEGKGWYEVEGAIRQAQKSGEYDGVIIKNLTDVPGTAGSLQAFGHDEYVTFAPGQIKSAIGNEGSFDYDNPSILKSALDPEFPIDDFSQVAAAKLLKSLGDDWEYMPDDFKAEMLAEFGNAIEPHWDKIYKGAWELRNVWLNEARKEKRFIEIRAKENNQDLEDWEIEAILDENRAHAERRRAIEKLHQVAAKGIKRPKNFDAMINKIADLSPNDDAALGAAMLAENLSVAQIADRLAKLGITDDKHYRKILREGRDVFTKAVAEVRKEADKPANELLEKKKQLAKVSDLNWKNRRELQVVQDHVARELRRLKQGEGAYRFSQLVEASNAFRTMMASFDLSAFLRQGGFLVAAHPLMQKRAIEAMKQSFTEKGYGQVVTEIENMPKFVLFQRMGIDFAIAGRTESDSSLMGEELYRGEEAIEKIGNLGLSTGLGSLAAKLIIKPSERTYTAFLDMQRATMANLFIDELQAAGITFEESPSEYRKLAKFINVATGRGHQPKSTLGKLILDLPFFAPRYTLSRLQLLNMTLNPVAYARMPAHTRYIVARSALRFYGVIGTILGIGALFGVVSFDDDDSDFLKIKIGNTRYDIWAGTLQPLRTIYQLAHAAIRGNRVPGEMGDRMTSVAGRFVRGKLSPMASLTTDYVMGSDYIGNEFNAYKAIGSRLVPLTISDMIEAGKLDGPIGIARSTPFTFFGIGVSNFKSRPERPRTEAEKLAAKAIQMKINSKPQSEEERKASELRADLTARSRKGEDIGAELAAAIEAGQVSKRQRTDILNAAKKTLLVDKAEGLSLDEVEAVFKVATAKEREELLPLMKKKLANAKKDKKTTPEQQARFLSYGVR